MPNNLGSHLSDINLLITAVVIETTIPASLTAIDMRCQIQIVKEREDNKN